MNNDQRVSPYIRLLLMKFSQSASPYLKSLASNQRLYLLINTDCEIKESNLNNWADASIAKPVYLPV